jgi:hypothetical protein
VFTKRTASDRPAVERIHPPTWITHLVNPVIRKIVASGTGRVAERLTVLEFTGRRSGKTYAVPVGYRTVDGRGAVFTNSRWRHNFAGGASATLVRCGRRQPVRAELLDDPTAVAAIYDRLLAEIGWRKAARQLAIRINVNRQPTRDELEDAVRRTGLSVIWLDDDGEAEVG